MVFIFKLSSASASAVVAASLFVLIILVALYAMLDSTTSRERMTDWDAATNSYNDDDCLSTWDKLVGGISTAVSTAVSTADIRPIYDSCIKRVANYTLVCPDETIYVRGCDGVTYKNACTAERNGIYNYSTENGVASN